MVTVNPKNTIRIQSDPIEDNKPARKLAEHFRSELKKRNNMENIEL